MVKMINVLPDNSIWRLKWWIPGKISNLVDLW